MYRADPGTVPNLVNASSWLWTAESRDLGQSEKEQYEVKSFADLLP